VTQQKKYKSVSSPILQRIFLIIFLQNRFYPDASADESSTDEKNDGKHFSNR